jgi:hypothetical protein
MPQIIGGMALVIVLLLGGIAYQQNVIGDLNKEMGQLEVANELAASQIEKLETQQKEDQASILNLSKLNVKYELEKQQENKKLEEYKQRKSAILGRPTLVEKLANRATDKKFKEIECLTGASCNTEE